MDGLEEVAVAPKRRTLSKKTRFEVFKRDKFTCQYCGRVAPDVVLNCDHITPVADGGTDELLNLITSCFDCNNGKRAKRLDDHSELTKQVDEMRGIQERREQIAMLKQWRDECRGADDEAIDVIDGEFGRVYNCHITDKGRVSLGRLIKKHGLREVLMCTVISIESYEDADTAFDKIPGIIKSRALDRQKPGMGRLSYIAAILRNRRVRVDGPALQESLECLIDHGGDVERVVDLAKDARNWHDFSSRLSDCIDQAIDAREREVSELFGIDADHAISVDPEREVW